VVAPFRFARFPAHVGSDFAPFLDVVSMARARPAVENQRTVRYNMQSNSTENGHSWSARIEIICRCFIRGRNSRRFRRWRSHAPTLSILGAVICGVGTAVVLLGLGAYFAAQEKKSPPLNPEIRAVFDRIVTEKANPTVKEIETAKRQARGAPAPQILYFADSKMGGCGATVRLATGEPCWLSIAQCGVLVKKSRFGKLGAVLYDEKNVYTNSLCGIALAYLFPEKRFPDGVVDPNSRSFFNAILHCHSASEVCKTLNEAIETAEKKAVSA
jgi:hypothetical protein